MGEIVSGSVVPPPPEMGGEIPPCLCTVVDGMGQNLVNKAALKQNNKYFNYGREMA
jgi:hypothetical protein